MFYGSLDNNKLLRPLRKYYSADGSMEIKHNIQTGATEFVTYIGGDGYTAPIVLKSDGTTQNYLYLQRDYQGSIVAISDATGQVLEKRLFDAWGNVLVQDGAGNTLTGLTVLDRGYTGHEHLQSVGLIHMNGRLYDPKLHRFLQPDNYVQDPSNTQNYNRYSYVLNNPLKYIDPSGESFWKSVASVFVSVAFSAVGIAVGISTGGAIGWVGYVDFNSGDWQVYAAGWGLIGTTPAGGFLNFGQTDGKFSFYGGIQTAPKFLNPDSKPKNGIDQSAPIVKPKSDVDGGGKGKEEYDPTGGILTGIGTGLTAGEIKMYNESTWFSVKQWKTYSQSFNGNGYTGGKIASALGISKGFKIGGYGLGTYGAWSINNQYNNGELNTSGMVMEQSSNLYSTFGGLPGAAWGIGWEGGRAITKTGWYQDWKNKYWYPWRHEHFGY